MRLNATARINEMTAAAHRTGDAKAVAGWQPQQILAALIDLVDLGGVLAMVTGAAAQSQPAMISFGAADRSAHLHIALPAATVRALSAARP
jgi:hypothetical protein